MVVILVGPEEKRFELPRSLLCESSLFFSKAFEGHFKEATDGTLKLPEDDPVAFTKLALWMYEKKIDGLNILTYAIQELREKFEGFCQLYYLADKLQFTALLDETMLQIAEFDKWGGEEEVILPCVAEIYDKTGKGSPLRDFVTRTLAQYFAEENWLKKNPGCQTLLEDHPGFAAEQFCAVAEFLQAKKGNWSQGARATVRMRMRRR